MAFKFQALNSLLDKTAQKILQVLRIKRIAALRSAHVEISAGIWKGPLQFSLLLALVSFVRMF